MERANAVDRPTVRCPASWPRKARPMPEEQPDLLEELPAEGAAAGALSPVKRRLLQSALAIEAAQDPASILFQHTCLCQTGLPYRDPGPGVPVWDRQQGAISLRIRAGEV